MANNIWIKRAAKARGVDEETYLKSRANLTAAGMQSQGYGTSNSGQGNTPARDTNNIWVKRAAKAAGVDEESYLQNRVTRSALTQTTNTTPWIEERAKEYASRMGTQTKLPSASELKSGGRTGADVRSSTRNIEAVQPEDIAGGVMPYKDRAIPTDYESLLSEIETAQREYEKAYDTLTRYETSHGLDADYTAGAYYSALSSELGRASTYLAALEKAKKNYEIRQEAEEQAANMSPYIAMTDDELNARIAAVKQEMDSATNIGAFFDTDVESYISNSEKWRGASAELAELQKELERREKLTQYASDVNKDNFWGRAESNFDVGQLTELVNEAYSNYLWNPTADNKAYAEQLAATLQQYQENNAAALDDEGWISKTAAGYLPQLGHQLETGIGGAALGGAAGAGVGSLIPGIGTATGGLWGARGGYVAGTGAYSFNTMRGAAYRELIEMGVDEATARAAATDEAVISALIEMVDAGIDLATLGTAKIASTPVRKVATALASYGINIGTEGLEEGAQQAVSIANRDRVESGEYDPTNDLWGKLTGLGFDAAGTVADAITGENPDARKEIGEASVEGMKIAAMFGGTGMAVNSSINTVAAKNAGSQIRSNGNVDLLVEIGRNADTNTESYKIATDILKKQNTGKSVSDTEIGWLYQAIRDDRIINQQSSAKTEEEATREAVSKWGNDEIMQFARETVEAREESSQSASEAIMNPARETVAQREKAAQTEAGAAQDGDISKRYGALGVKAYEQHVTKAENTENATRQFDAAYKLGEMETPRSKVVLENELQEAAYEAGRLDAVVKTRMHRNIMAS